MDLKDYELITQSPDTFPLDSLLEIREIIRDVGSPHTSLIEHVIAEGFIQPPPDYPKPGHYRIVLSKEQKGLILDALELAGRIGSTDRWHPYTVAQFRQSWRSCADVESAPVGGPRRRQSYYDLRKVSLSEFEAFLFGHEVGVPKGEQFHWYRDMNIHVDFSPEKTVDLFIELFQQSAELLKRCRVDELEQGFTAAQYCRHCNIRTLIWDSDLDFSLKEALIHSMFDLFAGLFSTNPIRNECHMWWDDIAACIHRRTCPARKYSAQVRQIQEPMFRTLVRILKLESIDCQFAALHGLGHVQHPETKQAITAYLDRHPELDPWLKKYARACIEGNML